MDKINKIIIEVIILKRTLVFALLLLVSIFIPLQNCKACYLIGALNNKTLNSDIAIQNGNVVMISYIDSGSNKTNNMEIYNISRLDDFINNINRRKKDKIRIVKYGKNATGTWVNKLYDLKYDGNKIADIEYDVYSDPNEFIPGQPLIFKKIIKLDYYDGISYRICNSDNKMSDCAYLISFSKSSIIEKKK